MTVNKLVMVVNPNLFSGKRYVLNFKMIECTRDAYSNCSKFVVFLIEILGAALRYLIGVAPIFSFHCFLLIPAGIISPMDVWQILFHLQGVGFVHLKGFLQLLSFI